MMFHYPYLGFPYYNRYSRYGYRYPNPTFSSTCNSSCSANTTKNKDSNISRNQTKQNNYCNNNPKVKSCDCSTNMKKEDSCYNENPVFQIFGINLYSDDILLLGLIFFLYQEGVKDQSLFISLFLLLLS